MGDGTGDGVRNARYSRAQNRWGMSETVKEIGTHFECGQLLNVNTNTQIQGQDGWRWRNVRTRVGDAHISSHTSCLMVMAKMARKQMIIGVLVGGGGWKVNTFICRKCAAT